MGGGESSVVDEEDATQETSLGVAGRNQRNKRVRHNERRGGIYPGSAAATAVAAVCMERAGLGGSSSQVEEAKQEAVVVPQVPKAGPVDLALFQSRTVLQALGQDRLKDALQVGHHKRRATCTVACNMHQDPRA